MESGKRRGTISSLWRFLFLLLAVGAFAGLAGCRLPPFDLATSLSLIDDGGDEPPGTEASFTRYLYIRGAGTAETFILDSETMTFSPGPALPFTAGSTVLAHPIKSGIRSGQYWVLGAADSTAFFDRATESFLFGPSLETNWVGNSNLWSIAGGTHGGKTLIRFGGGWAGTNRYDPATDTLELSTTSPLASGSGTTNLGSSSFVVAAGALAGQHMVIVGGSNSPMVYDPSGDSFAPGPALPNIVSFGSHSFVTSDGNAIVVTGGGTGSLMRFDAGAGTFANHITMPSNVGNGAHTARLSSGPQSGDYMIVVGNNSPDIIFYDHTGPNATTGPNLSASAGIGASTLYLSAGPEAGKYLIVHGSSTTASTIFDPLTITTAPGPLLPGSVNNSSIIPLN